MANRLLDLKQAKQAAITQAEGILAKMATENRAAMIAEEKSAFDASRKEAENIQLTIEATESLGALTAAASNIPSDGPETRRPARTYDNAVDKPWGYDTYGESCVVASGDNKLARRVKLMLGFGEYLRAVQRASRVRETGAAVDVRLTALNDGFEQRAAAAGASEMVPSDGGFLVAPDFSQEILLLAHETGVLHTMTRHVPISEFTNAIKIPAIDEQSRVDGSRWGGVQAFWENEAQALTGSKPTFALLELVTKKLTGLYYATSEILADARALGNLTMQAFGEEFGFKLDAGVLEGTGAGQMLGIENAAAFLSIAKETGQASATIVEMNIQKMWARLWARSRRNAIWIINQDCEPQLNTLSRVVGTGGVPMFTPAGAGIFGGLAPTPLVNNVEMAGFAGTLMGRPVMVMEQAQTLGTVGDIMLFDPTQYIMIDKGDLQTASSMHVRFLTDEMTYRWIFRVDGQPWWKKAITPYHGTNTLSPYIGLATR